jgi:hypothetical protein
MQKLRIRIGSVGTFHGVTKSVDARARLPQAGVMTAPPAQGVRLPYDEAPAELRAWVDDTLGSPVVTAVTQPGGFSPGIAARLVCADGTRAFCKAVSTAANPDSPQLHRDEARNVASLPAAAPVPRLIASYDEGTWVVLLLQDVGGRQPLLPWRLDELTRAVGAIDRMHDVLTPCLTSAPVASEEWHEEFTNWRLTDSIPLGLDNWCVRHLDALADLESQWEPAATGDTLLHMDLRADNLIVSDDRVWVVRLAPGDARPSAARPGRLRTERDDAGWPRASRDPGAEPDRTGSRTRPVAAAGLCGGGLLRVPIRAAAAARAAHGAGVPGGAGSGRAAVAAGADRLAMIMGFTLG